MISTVTLNPALDKSVFIDKLRPNDTNRVLRVETDAGGKGVNASRVLKELGTETLALGFVGGHSGRYIEHVLKHEGIPVDFVHIGADTRTNILVQEASGAPPTCYNERGPQVTDDEMDLLFLKVRAAAAKSSVVAFGGTPPVGVPMDIYKKLIQMVREVGAKTILDGDGESMSLGLEAGPYMIKPNRDEVRRLLGIEINYEDDAVSAAEKFTEYGVEVVVISMGVKGAFAKSSEGAWYAVPPDVKPVSTIGSGDSMVAGIAHVLMRGGSLEEALAWGSAAGAATAMTDGTTIGKRDQILALLPQVKVRKVAGSS